MAISLNRFMSETFKYCLMHCCLKSLVGITNNPFNNFPKAGCLIVVLLKHNTFARNSVIKNACQEHIEMIIFMFVPNEDW